MSYQGPVVQSKYFAKFEAALPLAEGKVIVITGTTSGTGLVAALTSAKKGARVVCLNRNSSRVDDFIKEAKELCPNAEFDFIPCDLQDFGSVRVAADTLLQKFSESGIDVLCCNAGIMGLEDTLTADNFDPQIQTNHLSHFLLVALLFPLLQKASDLNGESRIVVHSSGVRLFAMEGFNKKYYIKDSKDLGGNGTNLITGGRFRRYQQSKIANAMFVIELAKRLEHVNSKVRVFCADPGVATTGLQEKSTEVGAIGPKMLSRMMSVFGQSAEDGAMPLIHCMLSHSNNLVSGSIYQPKFVIFGTVIKSFYGPFVGGEQKCRELWKLSEEATEVKFDFI